MIIQIFLLDERLEALGTLERPFSGVGSDVSPQFVPGEEPFAARFTNEGFNASMAHLVISKLVLECKAGVALITIVGFNSLVQELMLSQATPRAKRLVAARLLADVPVVAVVKILVLCQDAGQPESSFTALVRADQIRTLLGRHSMLMICVVLLIQEDPPTLFTLF